MTNKPILSHWWKNNCVPLMTKLFHPVGHTYFVPLRTKLFRIAPTDDRARSFRSWQNEFVPLMTELFRLVDDITFLCRWCHNDFVPLMTKRFRPAYFKTILSGLWYNDFCPWQKHCFMRLADVLCHIDDISISSRWWRKYFIPLLIEILWSISWPNYFVMLTMKQ